VVATSGTALTEQHCRILGRYAQRAVLLFDGDAAGSAAAGRGIEVLLATGLDSRVVALPDGSDPDSYVREKGTEALQAAVEGADTALDFFLDRLALRSDLSTVAGKAQAVKAVIPLLERCGESVRRDLMLRQAAHRLAIDERALREDLGSTLKGRRSSLPRGESESAPEPAEVLPDPPHPERDFIALLLQHPRYISPTSRQLNPESFIDLRVQRLAAYLFDRCHDTDHLDMSLLMSDLDAPLVSLVSACAVVGFDEEQIESNWRESLLGFKREDLTRQIEQSKRDYRAAVEGGEDAEVSRIREHMDRLIRDRQELEKGEDP
jgi:DNA primase